MNRRLGEERDLSNASAKKITAEIQPLIDELSQNSTNREQHVNSPFQIQIGSHIVLTEHCFITLCSISCWILKVIYFGTDMFDKFLTSPYPLSKRIALSSIYIKIMPCVEGDGSDCQPEASSITLRLLEVMVVDG